MRLFLPVILLVTSSSGENPAVQVTLSSKALQYGKAKSGEFPSMCWISMACDEARCALPTRCVCGCRVDHREAGGYLSSRHQWWNVHLVWYLILHTDGVRASNCVYPWTLTPTHKNRDLLTPAFLICSITIENLEIPEPSVECYQESTGLKASASGLSVALTGGWMTKYGLMWGSQNVIHKKDKNFNFVFIFVDKSHNLQGHWNNVGWLNLKPCCLFLLLFCFLGGLQTWWWILPHYYFWRGCDLCGEAGERGRRSSVCHQRQLWGSRWRPGRAIHWWSQVWQK